MYGEKSHFWDELPCTLGASAAFFTQPLSNPMETTHKPPTEMNRQPLHVAQLQDALLTVKTVMAQTGLGRSTIHNKVKDGTFPAPIKLSARCVRWHSEAIQQWIQALATSAQ